MLSYSESLCPYCDLEMTSPDHLATCTVYHHLMDAFSNNPVQPRIYSGIRVHADYSISQSDDELPATIRYLDTSSLSSASDAVQQSSRNSTPEFRENRVCNMDVYPLRPNSKRKSKFNITCPVCFNEYEVTKHSPLVLPSCGHTICEECLCKIVMNSSMIKCPVCRQLNFKEVGNLPVNYALLELVAQKDHREFCELHQLELVGYCKDDEMLLCGACIFEHKDHHSFLLTDQGAREMAEEQLNLLTAQEAKLSNLKACWQNAICDLNSQFKDINEVAEDHIRKLKQTESQLIFNIKQGTRACVEQVRKIISQDEASSVQREMTEQVKLINSELGKLREKQNEFSGLSMAEKLKKVQIAEINVETPQMRLTNKKHLDLNRNINYKASIQQYKFPILNE